MALHLTVDTDQEAFDAMVRHLAQLPHRSTSDNGDDCSYSGLRCAVGAILNDPDEAERHHSGTNVRELPIDTNVNVDLLASMQFTHDCNFLWGDQGFEAWYALRDIANQFGLSAAVVDEVEAARANRTGER